jgi:hypothetical protein
MTTFGIGRVLATGFRVWIRNLLPFTLITAVIYSPLLIWGISTVHGTMDAEQISRFSTFEQVSPLLLMFFNLFVAAALTYGVVMELQGARASVGACIATGFARFFPVLGVAVLSALCICGASVLLVIPGLVVTCMLYVATPAAVIERPGVTGALGRSRDLTAGHRLAIFVLMVLLFGLVYLCKIVVVDVTLPYIKDPTHARDTLARLPLYMYVNLAREVLLGSLSAVMTAVTYYLLRSEKEGISAAELAAVFD